MRPHNGTANEHCGNPPHCGGGVHEAQHHQALREGPQSCLLLQLNPLIPPTYHFPPLPSDASNNRKTKTMNNTDVRCLEK